MISQQFAMRFTNCHEIVLELFNVSHTKNTWAASEYRFDITDSDTDMIHTFPYCIVYYEFIIKQYRQKVPGRLNASDFEVHILLTCDINGRREMLTQLPPVGHMTMTK